MTLSNTHPLYDSMHKDWVFMTDSFNGENAIKSKKFAYLPATSGMIANGLGPNMPGDKEYEAYKSRAIYHDYVSDAVKTLVGLLHSKPPVIKLPVKLEPLRVVVTPAGESLLSLLRQINTHQLTTGRLGLVLDISPERNQFYISLYDALSVVNWKNLSQGTGVPGRDLEYVVISEDQWEDDESRRWSSVKRQRVLSLKNGFYEQELYEDDTLLMSTPIRFMGKGLEFLPFVFINSKDNVPVPDNPPLIGLARLSLSIYRSEADYRQNLFMQGQDTLIITGSFRDDPDNPVRVGAGATINLPPDTDAKYIGVSANGLREQREALVADKLEAVERAGRLATQSSAKESGVALHMRMGAQTATLTKIALSGAAGLESILRMAASWVGADPEEVKVTPNLDFVQEKFDSREVVDMITAKNLGYPISEEALFDFIKERGLPLETYEEEKEKIESEVGILGTFNANIDRDDDS